MKSSYFSKSLFENLKTLRPIVPQLYSHLGIEDDPDLISWITLLDKKLLPRFNPNFPVIAAICGGGSSGKSTLFNTLSQSTISPSGGRAGLNRRVLIAAHPDFSKGASFLSTLYEPFQCAPQILNNKEELLSKGDPLYTLNDAIPKNLVLLDTPDFDTGSKGSYANRLLAEQSLETADIFIYIFTNSNYNNRDNTDFMAGVLTGSGKRKAILVYRCYPNYADEEIISHSMTVAHNIYGAEAEQYILGIYRADEDNAVAAGEKFAQLRPARQSDQPLVKTLNTIDRNTIRQALFKSALHEVILKTQKITEDLHIHNKWLGLYLEALKSIQIRCTQEALSHFPMDLVMKRFAQIWLATDPKHIKLLRKTGKVVETPMRWAVKSIKWMRGSSKEQDSPTQEIDAFTQDLKIDLVRAANQMYRSVVDTNVSVTIPSFDPSAKKMYQSVQHLAPKENLAGSSFFAELSSGENSGSIDFTIPSHPAVKKERESLKARDWKRSLEKILSQKETLVAITEGIENELADLCTQFRSKMNLFDQIQQTFLAVLNVLPATVAITYILATGDPIGATGVKVKLTGLFGLQDLYALVAIPATAGLKKADLNQLEIMLGPIAKSWLNDKLKTVQQIFDSEITGEILTSAAHSQEEATKILQRIEEQLEFIKKG